MTEDIYEGLDDFDPGPLVGYLRDPEKKEGETPDKVFTADLRPKLGSIMLAGDVDMRSSTTQTNQYSAPSCVGNAVADSVELLNAIENPSAPKIQLSRMFVWTLCRNMMDTDNDGRGDIDQIKGTYIRLAMEVLHLFGICREDLARGKGGWPYDMGKMKWLPDMKAMRAATAHHIHSYYRITETGEDRLDALLDALRSRHPVVFGTLVDTAFQRHKGSGSIGRPKGATSGGHAMMLVGYDSAKGFIVKNSWGTGWGEGGFGYLNPEYMTWENTWDIWVPTKGSMFR